MISLSFKFPDNYQNYIQNLTLILISASGKMDPMPESCSRWIHGMCNSMVLRIYWWLGMEPTDVKTLCIFRRDRLGQRPFHHDVGDSICPNMVRGIDYLRDPRLNKVFNIYKLIFIILKLLLVRFCNEIHVVAFRVWRLL